MIAYQSDIPDFRGNLKFPNLIPIIFVKISIYIYLFTLPIIQRITKSLGMNIFYVPMTTQILYRNLPNREKYAFLTHPNPRQEENKNEKNSQVRSEALTIDDAL